MAVSLGLTDGLTLGIRSLWPLATLPFAIALLAYLVFRGAGRDRSASRRSRRFLFASRLLIVLFLVVGAMGPYTVQTRETPGEPRVTLLVDESDSMGVYPNVTDDLVTDIEAAGIPASTSTIGAGTDSRLGDGIVANLEENGTVVVVSDGRVTEGQSLGAAAETARSLNATVSTVTVSPTRTERAVSIEGPSTAIVGLSADFTVSLAGARVDAPVPVGVSIDGETVRTDRIGPEAPLEFNHTFDSLGPHRVTARLDGEDVYAQNDVYYHVVRVVEKPNLLYVANGEYPLRGYLSSLYNVTNATTVPDSLDRYAAVVIQDTPAPRMGNRSVLNEYVIGGGGLVVVGGPDAYENGGYAESPIGTLLPVRVGEAGGGTTNLVMLIDISESTSGDLSTQKAIALDVLDQLGDSNQVGVVAFNWAAYRIADLQPLATNRQVVADRIRRLSGGGGTDIASGLLGADELLGERRGTIILLSDGIDPDPNRPVVVADQLGREGRRIIAVGAAANVDSETMTRIATHAGGSYFAATERSRLRLLFGGATRQYGGDNLTVVTPDTFITSGVELTSNPGQANDVSVKGGADYQIATADGTPAVVSWRFGLGRVVSITAYGADGSLDGLLERPDSLALTRSVNYAIGDPARSRTGVTNVGDARVGRPTTLTYRGPDRPTAPNLTVRQVGSGSYRGEFIPQSAGYQSVLDTTYAANYPVEYGQFGPSPHLSTLVQATGGRTFAPTDGEAIARLARQQATRVRTIRESWGWLALLAALALFTAEVVARRLLVYRGRTSMESGLP